MNIKLYSRQYRPDLKLFYWGHPINEYAPCFVSKDHAQKWLKKEMEIKERFGKSPFIGKPVIRRY